MAKLQAIDVRMEYYQPRTNSRLLAIDSFSISIEEGEFVSIVGPSGCGKSTFLKIVDGLVESTGGTLLVDGHTISKPGQDRAMVFQDASLFPWYTVLDNVAYGLECQGVRRKEARAGRSRSSSSSAWPASGTTTRTSCRAACSSGSTWPGPWPWIRSCC